MAFRPPFVLVNLWEHTLKVTGNVHRLQIVRYGDSPRAVVGLECREYIKPENVATSRPAVIFFDDDGWGMGMTKLLRIEHTEWIREHPDRVEAAYRRGKIETLQLGMDEFGRAV